MLVLVCAVANVLSFFVESQFPCYQLHIIPTLCMPLPPLKVICQLFRSCILQICGQFCSVCEPALPYFAVCNELKPVLLGYRKRSLKGNGSCESICEAHAWNMRKAKKKNMLGSGIPALHFSFMVVLFLRPAATTDCGGFLFTIATVFQDGRDVSLLVRVPVLQAYC